MIEDLIAQVAQAIEELTTERGFEIPLYVAAIAANGSAMILHYRWTDAAHPEEGLDADLVADHSVDPGFQFPINFMFVDATGERAARMVLNQIGKQWLH